MALTPSDHDTAPVPPRTTGGLGGLAAHVSSQLQPANLVAKSGVVVSASPASVGVRGLSNFVALGDMVRLLSVPETALGEVIRLEGDTASIKLYEGDHAVRLGTRVCLEPPLRIAPSPDWSGRIINPLLEPLDGKGALSCAPDTMPGSGKPPAALSRRSVEKGVVTGVRVIDLFTPLCCGQRIGIFAGSGVGKSTLLGMLARSTGFDRVVAVLVGERGREAGEFVEKSLGSARETAIVVIATGDESPMMRKRAPLTGFAIAEYFRDRGEQVLLLVDSVTRYAHACREVALAAGEPPVARGYPPGVFTALPHLLERAGPGAGTGTITGLFTVLVDGDDHHDPVADAVRGILDGHIVLDRSIGEAGRFPAVNLLSSVSRLAPRVWTGPQRTLVTQLKMLVARFEDSRDLRAMGAWAPGKDEDLDRAVAIVPRLYRALAQTAEDASCLDAFRELATSLSESEPRAQNK